MRRAAIKKFLSGFIVLTLLSSEIGAAQIAPVLPPSFLRPPALNPGNPVPQLPPHRVFVPEKYNKSNGKSLFSGLRAATVRRLRNAHDAGGEYLSRPARNVEVYKQAYGARVSAYMSRPARNWTLYKGEFRRLYSQRRVPQISLPELTRLRAFSADVWEGLAATVNGIAGLGALISFVVPQGGSFSPVPVPAGHAKAFSDLLGLSEKPKPRTVAPAVPGAPLSMPSSMSYVVPERRDRYGSRPVWRSSNGHLLTFVSMLTMWNDTPDKSKARRGIWTQKDAAGWERAEGREGTSLPRFATFYLRDIDSPSGAGADAMLSFMRLKGGEFGASAKAGMFGTFTDYKKGIIELERAEPRGNGMVKLTMHNGDTRTMKVLEVKEVSPLVFDLDGDGVRTGTKDILYDFDGNGRRDLLTDISAGDAVLVFDADGDGVSGENGTELFGDLTDFTAYGREAGYRDGFASLGVMAERAAEEGVISREAFAAGKLGEEELTALERRYGLKAKVGSLNAPAISLVTAGIAEVFLSAQPTTHVKNFDGRGNSLTSQRGAEFTRADGTTGAYADVWFQYISAAFSPGDAV